MSISTWVGSFTAAASSLPAWLSGGTIRADGWSIDAASTPPSTTLEYDLTVTRQGYTSGGAPTTYTDALTYVTRRVRVPGSTSLDALRVGLSFDIYQGDSVAGLTNASTTSAPPVAANYETLDRDVIGDTLPDIEVGAMHQFGVPVLVRFTATDGVNPPVTFDATMPVAVKSATDALHRVVFRWTGGNISALANGIIKVTPRCFPLYGGSSAILDADTTGFNWWEFAPRYFIKDPTRAGTLVRCYVATSGDSPAGNDTTGVWSTDDATARANPFLTISGALGTRRSTIVAGAWLPAQSPDGCEIRLRAGTFVVQAATSITQHRGGAVIITRDPTVDRVNAIAQLSTSAARPRLTGGIIAPIPSGALRFRDVTLSRTATGGQIQGEAATPLAVQIQNVTLDNNSNTNSIALNNGATLFMDGVTCSNMAGSALAPAATAAIALMRGVTGTMGINVQCTNVTGCKLGNVAQFTVPTAIGSTRNATFQATYVHSKTDSAFLFYHGGASNVAGYARWNNICEVSGTTDFPNHRVSGDADTGNTTGCYFFHETFAGFNNIGRHNDRYVDQNSPAGSPIRTHVLQATIGCLMVQYNSKHDLHTPASATRIGGWTVDFGVGTDHNFVQFLDAGAGGFAPSYFGRGSIVGTSNTIPLNPLFVTPAHTTIGPVGGAGDGNYRILTGSPCKSKNLGRVYVPFDADGVARGVTTSIGAFV